MVRAAGGKPIWMTLQIAWSGVIATERHPANVQRFPSLSQERFMAYQAIVNGARGLAFFGGHLTQIARPADAQAGWNWTFWERVLRPLLEELASDFPSRRRWSLPTCAAGSRRAPKTLSWSPVRRVGSLRHRRQAGSATSQSAPADTGQAHGRRGHVRIQRRGVQDGQRRRRQLRDWFGQHDDGLPLPAVR